MVTSIQQWFPLLTFTHQDFPDSLNLFTILWTVDGERPKFFAILHWESLSLNWLKILSQSLAQSGEPRPCNSLTIHPCLQRLSLWWMLLLYSILITSPVTSKTANCGTFQNSVTCNLFSLVLPLSQPFLSVLQASHFVVGYKNEM